MFSFFEIAIRKDGEIVQGMRGIYTWDGKTCPSSADALIHEVRVAIGSSVDETRYEQANARHGFVPVLDWIEEDCSVHSSLPGSRYSIQDFVTANPIYSLELSATLEQVGPLPTDPSS